MELIEEEPIKLLKVCRGMRIEISVDGHRQIWDIVGHGQGDVVRKLISEDTPLVQLILGMEVGQKIKGQFGNRELSVKILNISKTPKKERMY